jgi:antitoxin component YwqK of YwqJK toxin-antitoxin module
MINSYKHRIVSGSVALALAAGAAWAAPAGDAGSQKSHGQYQNIFLNDIETAKYSEENAAPGVIGEVEVVRERYPDGKVRIERQVTLNNDGNYVNHGAWKQFTTDGEVIAEGQYNFGQRNGMWTRWVGPKDASLLTEVPFKAFKAPFMSQANFVEGKMDGEWTITDANDRKVMQVSLKTGERQGPTTIYMPNGKLFRQISYDRGTPVGDLMEVNPKTGELTKTATYENGRKVTTKTEQFGHSKQLRSEINYLAAKSVEKAPDDFWTTTLAKFASEGKDLRHGSAKTWYSNGQLEQQGAYQNDKKTGNFTFWHENGQISTTGAYHDDQPEGNWVWYYENGQKSALGSYKQGKLVGDWRWWDEQGKLTKQQVYNGIESASAQSEEERTDVSKVPAKSSHH